MWKRRNEAAQKALQFFIISMINRKFRTYTEKDPEFYEDLLQAGRLGIILSMPTTYFFPAIMHEMTALTNGMKHDAKSRIAALKRKMQEVDKKFEGYDRTPSLHDYAYNMGKSFNCITDALAQIKASDTRISMYDPDEAIVCCFLEASKGPTETTWLAEKYHRSPSGITAGILNLKNALKCHEGIRELYPEFFQGKGKIRIPSRTSMEKADLCHLYDAVYSERSDSILYEVSRNRLSDSDIGFLCRYVCEHYLYWGPEETMQKLSRMVLQTMKLDNLVEEMNLPRYFLSGSYGAEQNARICLMYVLQTSGGCHTAGDCIRFMPSREMVSFLREARLYQVMNRRYKTPAAYVNDALAMVGMLDLEDLSTDLQKKYISAQKQR